MKKLYLKSIGLCLITALSTLIGIKADAQGYSINNIPPGRVVEPDAFLYSNHFEQASGYEFHIIQYEYGIDTVIYKQTPYFTLNELGEGNIFYNSSYIVKTRSISSGVNNEWTPGVRIVTPHNKTHRYGYVRIKFNSSKYLKYISFGKFDNVVKNSEIPGFNALSYVAGIHGFHYPLKKTLELTGGDPYSYVELIFDPRFSVDSIISFFTNTGFIEYAEPHYTYMLASIPDEYNATVDSDNDNIPDFWHLTDVNAPAAWNLIGQNNNERTIIAVLDNVFDIDHEDLRKNIYINTGEIPQGIIEDSNGNGAIDADDLLHYYIPRGYNSLRELFTNPPHDEIFDGIDDDGNGYIDDICGWNMANGNNNVTPVHLNGSRISHGTHVAGIAGGESGNGVGICALSNNKVMILPIKLSDDNEPYESNISDPAFAIEYILSLNQKPKVISMSLAGAACNTTSIFGESLRILEERDNTLTIGATGNNSSQNLMLFPAWFENVIAVGATNITNNLAAFSNYGDIGNTYVLAPGEDIYSTYLNTQTYGTLSGTSMAAPLVCSLAGLLVNYNPGITPANIRRAIECGCNNNNNQIDNYNISDHGFGKIDAYKSLVCLMGMAPEAFIIPEDGFHCPAPRHYLFTGTSLTSVEGCSYNWSISGGMYEINGTLSDRELYIRFLNPGIYTITLEVANSNGSGTHSIEVDVKFPSVNIMGGNNILTCAGNNTTVYLEFEGNPPFRAVYNFNGTSRMISTGLNNYILNLETSGYSEGTSHTFEITSVWDGSCVNSVSESRTVIIEECLMTCSNDGQYNNIKHFCRNAIGVNPYPVKGLLFNPSPVLVDNPFSLFLASSLEGAASISDRDGNPVLAASGGYVYSIKEGCNNGIINNGQILSSTNVSATQGHMILPDLTDNNKYYIICVSDVADDNPHLAWGVVDFSEETCGSYNYGGKYYNSETEKLTACTISDESGYWILTHRIDRHAFNIYRLSFENGNVSFVGTQETESSDIYLIEIGEMKFDLKMEYLAVSYTISNKTELYRFNRQPFYNGDRLELIGVQDFSESPYRVPYSVEFSPDSKLIYFGLENSLLQMPVQNFGNENAEIIYSGNGSPIDRIMYLTLGPDMKLYVAHDFSTGVVLNPNNQGTGCNYLRSIYQTGQTGNFPPRIPSLSADFRLVKNTGDCILKIKPHEITGGTPSAYMWNNGMVSSEIIVNEPGTYSVQITFENGCVVNRSIGISEEDIYGIPEISFEVIHPCEDQANGRITAFVNGGIGPFSFIWQDGQDNYIGNTSTVTGLETGNYYLTVTDANGCSTHAETFVYNSYPPEISIDILNHICIPGETGSAQVIYEGFGDYNYLWSNGEATRIASNLPSGVNYVTVSDANGCQSVDSVEIINFNADAFFKPSECITINNPSLYFNAPNIPYLERNNYLYRWELDGQLVSTSPEYYPDFTYDGYYCLKLTLKRGDCMNTYQDRIFVNPSSCYCNHPYAVENIEVTADQGWTNRELWILKEMVIKEGSKLIAKNCIFHFGPEGRLIIEKRAELESSGCTFTSFEEDGCNHMWHGIEVHGQPTMTAEKSFQGILELFAGSVVSNAHIGVLLSSRDLDYICYRDDPQVMNEYGRGLFPMNYSGGLIHAERVASANNAFINNGIHIKGIRKQGRAINNAYNISIKETAFTSGELIDARYKHPHETPFGSNRQNPWTGSANERGRTYTCIDMESLNGFKIENCSFEKAEYCMRTVDSKYDVRSSSFYDASFGIFIYNTNSNLANNHEISGCTFDMIPGRNIFVPGSSAGGIQPMSACIYISGGRYDYIHDNYFGNESSQQHQSDHGIYVISSSGFNITENDLWNYRTGVYSYGSGETGGYIGAGIAETHISWQGNRYFNTGINISTSGNNQKLTLKCNICNNDVPTLFSVNILSFGTLAKQGSARSWRVNTYERAEMHGAGNEFWGNEENSRLIKSSTTQPYNYYHQNNIETTPILSSSNSLRKVNLSNIRVDKTSNYNACEPRSPRVPDVVIARAGITLDESSIRKAINTNDNLQKEINNLKEEYNKVIRMQDNGKTYDLLNYLIESKPDEIYKELISCSPLSDTVLINLIIEYPLPDNYFYDILVLNSPVSKNVKRYLDQRLGKLPEKMVLTLNDIQAYNPNVLTATTITNEIELIEEIRTYSLNNLMLALTNVKETKFEIAEDILSNESSLDAKRNLISTYIYKRDFDRAKEELEKMVTENEEERHWVDYQKFLLNLSYENRNFYNITDSEMDFLRKIASHCPAGLATANAQSFLEYYFGEMTIPCEVIPEKNIEVTDLNPINILLNNAYIMDNYPDPFIDNTNIDYYVPEGSNGMIFINDIYGRRVYEFQAKNGENTLVISSSGLEPGIYTYGLIVDGNIIGYNKMVVIE